MAITRESAHTAAMAQFQHHIPQSYCTGTLFFVVKEHRNALHYIKYESSLRLGVPARYRSVPSWLPLFVRRLVTPQELFPDDMRAMDVVKGQAKVDERAAAEFLDEFPKINVSEL